MAIDIRSYEKQTAITMASKSVVVEVKEITLAIELIELGARLQLLEAETNLSRDRLIKLYKELKGVSRRRACCRSRPTGS